MQHHPSPTFLDGGGEMGALIRGFDWHTTPLGSVDKWPQSLRTVVRLMLNTRHPIYIFWGDQGTCLYNDAYALCIGPDRHPSSLGQPAHKVWLEIWPIIGHQIEQVMAGRGATWHENQLVPITRGNRVEEVYWTYGYSPIDEESAVTGVGGVLVVCTETTKEVVAARKLAESEQRLHLALSAGRGIGTWDWDIPRDRVVADSRFAQLYGVDPAIAAQGAPIAEYFAAIHHQDLPRVQEHIDSAMRTGERLSVEYRLVHGERECWVIAEGRCEFDALGQPVRFPGVSFDITDRRNTEQLLLKLNADLERRVSERAQARGRTWLVSPDLMGALNSRGYFETSNPAWQTLLGWTEEEVASMSIFELLHPEDVERTRSEFNLTHDGQPAIGFSNRFRDRDGNYHWISWVGVPEEGMVYCSGRDVTEEFERAEALKHAEESLRQAQKMEAIGQLTGGIAHDFNNLLGTISNSLQIIRIRLANGSTEGLERFIGMGEDSTRRAAALTHRLLAFSRRQTLDPKPLEVGHLVRGMEDMIRRAMGPAIEIQVIDVPNPWRTRVDASQLENSLLNLCINARHAMPDGGRLTMETSNHLFDAREAAERELSPGQYISLCVIDTGTGMDSAVAERIFDPFYTTKPVGMGTGLGLSMVYGFVRQSGGQVQVHSEIGKGTTMCLYLPRYLGAEVNDLNPPPLKTLKMGDGETILVVEDEEGIRVTLAEILTESGYSVLTADNGPSGLKILESGERIDLLVTDVGLPGGLNGRQIADSARAGRPGLKVLFITGYADNAAVGDGQLEQGMAIMTKPFELPDLCNRVKTMLGQA